MSQQQNANLQERVKGLETAMTVSKTEHERATDALDAEIATLNAKLKRTSTELMDEKARHDAVRDAHSSCAATIQARDADIRSCNTQIFDLESARLQLMERIQGTEMALAEVRQALALKEQERDEAVAAHAPCLGVIASLRSNLAVQVRGKEAEVLEKDTQIAVLEGRIQELTLRMEEILRAGGTTYGVGMLLEGDVSGQCYVAGLLPEMPADLSGQIQVKDILYKVDDDLIAGWHINDVRARIMGASGSPGVAVAKCVSAKCCAFVLALGV